MYSKKLLIFVLCLGSSALFAQEQNYALGDILNLGLAHSHQLKMSTSQQKINELTVKEAKMAYTPSLSVSGQAMMLNQPTIRFMGNPLGGGVNPKSAAFVMGSLKIPVFNGFQLKNNLKASKEMALAGQETANLDSTVVVVNLIDAYVALYRAQMSTKIIQENLANAQQRVSDFEKMKENGLVSLNDYLKVQLQASNIEISLIDVQNQQDMAQYNLDVMTGLDETTKFTVDSNVFYTTPLVSSETSFDEIIENRKDIQSLEHQKNAAEYLVKLEKNSYYPHVNLTGMYASMNVPSTFAVYNLLNGGVSVSFDISSFYKKGPTVEKRKAQLSQLTEQTDMLTEKVKTDTHKAFLDYQKSIAQLNVYVKTVQQAEENYHVTLSKYDNSLVTTTDLLDADLALLQAKINHQLAKADVFATYCNYLKTTGNLNLLRNLN